MDKSVSAIPKLDVKPAPSRNYLNTKKIPGKWDANYVRVQNRFGGVYM